MTKKRCEEDWIAKELPVVSELRQCRQLAEDHWQGIDVDGTILDVRGGSMPRRLLAFRGSRLVGLIRVIPA